MYRRRVMKCDTHQLTQHKNHYLILATKKDPKDIERGVLNKIGEYEFFKTIDIEADKPYIALDSNEVIKNINNRGYDIIAVSITCNVTIK